MLGIRRFHKVAIDLWQGDGRSFVCDVMVPPLASSLWQEDQGSESQLLAASQEAYPAQWLLSLPPRSGAPSDLAQLKASYRQCWQGAAAANLRHLALSPLGGEGEQGLHLTTAPGAGEALIAMEDLKEAIALGQLGTQLKRVTFVVSQASTYRQFQEALFATFPEEEP